MKTEFVLTLFDDDRNHPLPPEYYYFSDEIPMGRKIKVTFELIEE